MKLFKSFKDWREYTLSSLYAVIKNLFKLFWSCLGGAISCIVNSYTAVRAYSKREPKATLITAFLLLAAFLCCIFIFVNERAMRVKAEYQRDSISIKFDSMTQNSVYLDIIE